MESFQWLKDLFTTTDSVAHITLLYAIVIAIGVYLGKLKVFGVSLGVTFVLFAGIVAGHIGFTAPTPILTFVQDFGLILFVFMALCSILFLVLGKEPIEDTPAFAFGIGFLVGIALYIAPLIFFGRSLKAAKAAVESDDDAQLTEAFKNQKSLLKYTGILTIVLLAFYVVVLIAVIVGPSVTP